MSSDPSAPGAAELLALGQSVLAAQPFSQLLGARLTKFEQGLAELVVDVKSALLQQHGFVHGGVISYLADNALTYAAGSMLAGGVVTSEFKINYLRPAVGKQLIARATAVYAGKTQAVSRCDIYAVDETGVEKLCAVAQGAVAALTNNKGG